MQEPHQLDYQSIPCRSYRSLWKVFSALSLASLLIATSAIIGQFLGWGVPLLAGIEAGELDGSKPARQFVVYGVNLGFGYADFAQVFLFASVLPILWIGVAYIRWIVPWVMRKHPAAPPAP